MINQRYGNEQRNNSYRSEEPLNLVVLKQVLETSLQTHKVERVANARQHHEYGYNVLYKRRVPISNASLLGRITSGAGGRERMTYGIEQVHASQQKKNSLCNRKYKIHTP